MKALVISIVLTFLSLGVHANLYAFEEGVWQNQQNNDSVKLIVDGDNAYYQKAVKVDSNIKEGLMYGRVLQFAASKNFQQNYGYQEEGKLIFTTTQDLNINQAYVGDDNDTVEPYTVQFALTLDLKNGGYRYTIHNVIFYLPTENGNRREGLFDIYQKATGADSRRLQKNAKKLIDSFERYISALTKELYAGIEQKSQIYNKKF
jgi:hypothetical protein